MITELSTGFPGYDSIIGPDNATIGTILKGNGYATSWFGKNHNTPAFQYSVAGPFDQWPSGMGFDYFYGFMGGETDQWTPYLFRDHTQIFPWIGKPDYNLTTDMADEAIGYMKQLNAAAPDTAVLRLLRSRRKPLAAPAEGGVESTSSRASSTWAGMPCASRSSPTRSGWGSFPANAQLTPWPDSLPKWDTLSADEKKLFARQAEVFAGYTAYTDYEIGRVIQQVEDMGKLDNTLIIYIVGDNGTSPEGTMVGTPNQYTSYNGILDFPIAEQLKFYDAWGSAATYPHMAVAWSWAFDTPFKWTKQVASHFGGTRQGMAISWPARIKDAGGIRTPVPPHHRHRADDPRSHGHQGAGDGRRHQAKADRRREHGVHLRQGERQRALDAQDPVLRDDRQPRDLSRRLVRQHDAAAWAVGVERADAGPNATTSGSCTT